MPLVSARGADSMRLIMLFAGPFEDDIDWADMNPEAMVKFLGRVLLADRRRHDSRTEGLKAHPPRGTGGRHGRHRTSPDHPPDHQQRGHPAGRGLPPERGRGARLMELVSATRRAIDSGPGGTCRPSATSRRP